MSEQKRLDRPDKQEMAKVVYRIVANELSQFIDEFKIDVRKPREWDELPDKSYWHRAISPILALIPDIEELQETIAYLEEAIQVMPECLEEEAKKQERERILKLYDDMMEQKAFVDLHILVDTFRQALKGEK